MNEPNVIERAFELARSGGCRSLEDIRKALSRERFANVDAHLSGAGIRSQLKLLMRKRRELAIGPVISMAEAKADRASLRS